jgi:ElaB/YqjD/DUF883 family membrane-anchored ribosome-binding protein
MGSSTEELTTEIATTRTRMASDIDALQDRVSPSAMVHRRTQAAKSRVAGLRDRVMGTAQGVRSSAASTTSSATSGVQDAAHGVADRAQGMADTAQERIEGSPLAAGLVAFGAGMVIAALIPASKKEAEVASAVVDTVRDQGAPLLEEAKSVGQQMGQDLKETAGEAAAQVKDAAAESASRVKDEGQSAAEHVRSDAQGNEGTPERETRESTWGTGSGNV